MPILESSSGTSPLAAFVGYSVVEADLSVPVSLSANFHGKSTIVADLTGGYPTITFRGKTTITATLTVPIDEPIVFAGSTSIEAALTIVHYDAYELRFAIDILPADSSAANVHDIWLPRLKVDGVEIGIVSGNYVEAKNSAGAQLNVVLADPDDRGLITAGSEIAYGVGKQIAGVWDEATFDTLFAHGQADSKDLSIGWENNGPTDAVSISVGSDLTQKLLTTPARDLVMYDSSRQTLQQTDFDILYDTDGNQYLTELLPVAGMSFYDLLRMLATRCGLAAYQTNLPDFPVSRVDCPIGQPLLNSIGGVFGMFEPVVFLDGNTIWIVDTTIAMPAGFPAARTVGIDDYRTLNVSDNSSKLDALIVQYVEDKRNFDFVTQRTEQSTETVGAFADPGYTVTQIERIYSEYRKLSQPAVIISTELVSETRLHSGHVGDLGESRETYDFDQLGRFTGSTKRVYARVPDLATGVPAITLVSEETETVQYSVHPFQVRSQYVSRRDRQQNGLIAVDAENQQLGRDFEREYTGSYRSGNLVDTMTTRFGAIKTIVETSDPRRDGQVTIKTVETDHLSNTVIYDSKEVRAGDISIYGTTPTPNRVLVFDADNVTRTTERTEPFSIGELPLLYGLPLARRRLTKRKTKSRSGRPDVIGYSRGLRKGLPIQLGGRNGDTHGNYIILGRTITSSSQGTNIQPEVTEI